MSWEPPAEKPGMRCSGCRSGDIAGRRRARTELGAPPVDVVVSHDPGFCLLPMLLTVEVAFCSESMPCSSSMTVTAELSCPSSCRTFSRSRRVLAFSSASCSSILRNSLLRGARCGGEFIPLVQEGVRAVHGCARYPGLFGEVRFRQPAVGIDRSAAEQSFHRVPELGLGGGGDVTHRWPDPLG